MSDGEGLNLVLSFFFGLAAVLLVTLVIVFLGKYFKTLEYDLVTKDLVQEHIELKVKPSCLR
jgi:hypothetical protein